jgi:N-acetylglucosaminyldiphosphoundecaprenol N-acetyl-beta-D-mannosaminyltransferase
LFGKSPLVGSRLDPEAPRGLVSPVQARVMLGIDYIDALAAERAYRRSFFRDLGVVLRAVIAALLSARGADIQNRPFVVSSRVDALTIPQACEAILSPQLERAQLVFFAHPHALNLARFDRQLARRFAAADLVLPDGIGLRLAARILGFRLRHNLNGTDMLPLLCRGAAERGLPLVFVGGAPGVAQTCAERLKASEPGLDVAIATHGFQGAAETRALIERIRAVGPCVVLVGMGTPLQEAWATEHLSGLRGITAVTVGGVFDFYAGRIPRAPLWWRELGLEWLFRLIQEPRRLARRYLLGNPLFLTLAFAQRLTGNRGPAVTVRALPTPPHRLPDGLAEGLGDVQTARLSGR